MRAFALALAALAAAAPLRAQASRFLAVSLGAGNMHLHTAPASGPHEKLSGVTGGGSGTLSFRRLSLEVFYAEGNLTPDTGSGTSPKLVDGSFMLVVRPVSWLSVKAGRHLRAYVTPAYTARPAAWELRLRGEGALVGDRVRAFVEGFHSLEASTNVGAELDGWQGGSAGLVFQLPRAPLWGRLSYFIDQTSASDGAKQTLDGLTISIGFGGR